MDDNAQSRVITGEVLLDGFCRPAASRVPRAAWLAKNWLTQRLIPSRVLGTGLGVPCNIADVEDNAARRRRAADSDGNGLD